MVVINPIVGRPHPAGRGFRALGSASTNQQGVARVSVRHALGGYQEYAPPMVLAQFCESVWVYRTPPGLACSTHRVLPDLAFNIGVTYVRDWGGRVRDGHAWLSAPKTRPVTASFPTGRETVAIKVKMEWASAVAGIIFADCRDTQVDLADLRPSLAGALVDVLEASRGIQDVTSGLIDTLARHSRPPRRHGLMVAGHALDVIRRADGRLPVDHVAAQVGMSTRYMRRIVHRDAGLSPKAYARTLRFLGAMRLADARSRTSGGVWARIAAEAGFFDQSHLIRESRALAGFTPQELWQERRSEIIAELHDAGDPAMLA